MLIVNKFLTSAIAWAHVRARSVFPVAVILSEVCHD
jgi:hypothetical protein